MVSVTGAATLMRGLSAVTPAAPARPTPVLFRKLAVRGAKVVRWGLLDRVRCFTAGSSRLAALRTRVPSAHPG